MNLVVCFFCPAATADVLPNGNSNYQEELDKQIGQVNPEKAKGILETVVKSLDTKVPKECRESLAVYALTGRRPIHDNCQKWK